MCTKNNNNLMLHVNVILETRKTNSEGKHDVKIKVSRKQERFFVSTGIYLEREQWDDGKVVNHPSKTTLNRNILSLLNAYTDAAYNLRLEESRLTMAEIKERIKMLLFPNETQKKAYTLLSCFEEYVTKFTKAATVQIYKNTMTRLGQFGDVAIDNINVAWLNSFDKWLTTYCPKKNARNIHLRNIRAVMNFAIDMEYTNNYPFRRYTIRPEETIHRALTREQLRTIATTDYGDEVINYHRDMFMLSFLLIGINYEDMAHLTEIVRGRVNYHRAKTNKLYSIKVEQEALDIINRHRGDGHLVNILNKYKKTHYLIIKSNKNLKNMMPGLTTYYARHTWATLAAELDIPKETISAALGHSMGSSTTSIYIRFDQRKIDDANRKVIDYVFG